MEYRPEFYNKKVALLLSPVNLSTESQDTFDMVEVVGRTKSFELFFHEFLRIEDNCWMHKNR